MLAFSIELTRDDNGTFLVTCPDLPEVTTYGEDEEDAKLRALDAIEEAVAGRIADREEIPVPSPTEGRVEVMLPVLVALKVHLHQIMVASGVRKADLARKLDVHAPQVDRLLNIRHASRLDQMEAAFRALGHRIDLHVE
jgi:antitoxin HicB